MQTPAPIMTPPEFAAFVRRSKSYINELIKAGKLGGIIGAKGNEREHVSISVLHALQSLNLPEKQAAELLALIAPQPKAEPVSLSIFISVPSTLQPSGAVVSLAHAETPQPARESK